RAVRIGGRARRPQRQRGPAHRHGRRRRRGTAVAAPRRRSHHGPGRAQQRGLGHARRRGRTRRCRRNRAPAAGCSAPARPPARQLTQHQSPPLQGRLGGDGFASRDLQPQATRSGHHPHPGPPLEGEGEERSATTNLKTLRASFIKAQPAAAVTKADRINPSTGPDMDSRVLLRLAAPLALTLVLVVAQALELAPAVRWGALAAMTLAWLWFAWTVARPSAG